jgi:TonB family protein
MIATRDGRVRSEVGAGENLQLQVFDGSTLSVYTAATNSYWQRPAKTAAMPALDMRRYGRDPANIISAAVEREESVQVAGKETPCYVVRAGYKGIPGSRTATNVVRTAWITRDREIVVRDSWEMEFPRPNGTRQRTMLNYASVECDTPLSDDLFVFKPPQGSKAVAAGGVASFLKKSPPQVIQRMAPEYSPEARAANYQGSVLVSVYVDEDGQARDVKLVRALGMGLDQRALAAVRQWRFKAATTDGKPVGATQPFEVDFKLPDGGPWQIAGISCSAVAHAGQQPALFKRLSGAVYPSLVQYGRPDLGSCPDYGEYVAVKMRISEKGVPGEITVSAASSAAIQQTVLNAVQSWKFDPARVGKARVPSNATILLRCDSTASAGATPNGNQPIWRVGGGVTGPRIIFRVEPEYSEEARKAKLQGTVMLYIEVEASGTPGNIQVLRALGLGLDEKAAEAVAQWRFRPGMKEGKPVTVQATVEVNFRFL